MKSVDWWQEPSGTWVARIFDVTYRGTYEEIMNWLRGNGELV